MTKLGEKFFLSFETLNNEKIIWEGGPSKKSFWAEFFNVFRIWGGLLILIWFFVTFIFFITSIESDCSNNKNNKEQSQQVESSKKDTSQKEKLNFPITIYIVSSFSALLAIFFLTLIITKFKLKTYWYVVTNERVCIQHGLLEKEIITIDLDKTISIKIRQSFVERLLQLNSIQLVHGGLEINTNNLAFFNNPNQLKYLDMNDEVSSSLINEWLPRDNQ